ncbi:phosphoserine phosphatase SerB [Actinobacteria bacterium YIM 96077]|uniref:phosphoserine phosphatase n=1 Tax=Phytoactinopolyspora halophila TaxID=1981511 RepID=A0A329QPG2_9ACTN|nr:phosphoserine phosphatase SerB [Phytoactinopolyspora halophila]AYY12978.1 phosphoserine phosphatase SerB [Actinobacteria bacterium YIM 96077]RAW13242.1 phosphoserine phosphatase SerB [Phytoactinopolyspora halophila]
MTAPTSPHGASGAAGGHDTAAARADALLVTFTGQDRPGLTSSIFAALAPYEIEIRDIEQVTAGGKLVLAALLGQPPDRSTLQRTLADVAAQLELQVELSHGHRDPAPTEQAHVTVLGYPLRPTAIEALAGRIARTGANIDRIVRLASYPVTSIELEVSGTHPEHLKAELADEALTSGVDVAVQPSGLIRRAKRLVVMDVDSTLVQGEVVEMLAARAGVLDQVAGVTAAAMRGELDFAESLRARVELLAGLPASALDDVRNDVIFTPGARTLVRTLKRLDYQCAIVSGGFSQITDGLASELELDYAAANTLEIVDGRLTGRLSGPVLDRAGKAAALRRFAAEAEVPLSQTIAIGDGANDLDMIATAGLGVAFNAKPVVRSAADAAVNVPYLDAVLYLLGISREEIEAADAADGYTTPAPPVPQP